MKHSGNKWQGNSLEENLAMAYPKMTSDMAANIWYNEIKNYNWAKPAFQGNTEHFRKVLSKWELELQSCSKLLSSWE